MTLYHPYADRFSAMYGKRRTITRDELRDYILAAQKDGLDVSGYFGYFGQDAPVYDIPESARRIANIPHGIMMLSLGGNVRDIQYDEPGSMHPQQFAALTFVGSEELRRDHYIQRHAHRVVRVDGDPLPPPPPPPRQKHRAPYHCPRCVKEVTVEVFGAEDEVVKCPRCGDDISEWYV